MSLKQYDCLREFFMKKQLKLEDVKFLPLSKRLGMLHVLILVAKADDQFHEREQDQISVINTLFLNLTPSEIKMANFTPEEMTEFIQSMRNDELLILAVLMKRVASSDGNVDSSEERTIRTLLKIGKLSPEIINYILFEMNS